MEESKRIGILGEEAVAGEYIRRKCRIFAANYRCRFGEIDIIAQKDNYYIICEVKTRKKGSIISAAEAVSYQKQQRIIAATKMFLAEKKLNDVMIRFDVAEVSYDKDYDFQVNIIENAFSV